MEVRGHNAPVAFLPGTNTGTLLMGGWVDPRANLDGLENKKSSWPSRRYYSCCAVSIIPGHI